MSTIFTKFFKKILKYFFAQILPIFGLKSEVFNTAKKAAPLACLFDML